MEERRKIPKLRLPKRRRGSGGLRSRSADGDLLSAARVASLQQKVANLDAQVANLQYQLAEARKRPLRVFREYAMYRVLSFLSRESLFLPIKMTERFGRSASKRNPLRSLPDELRALTAVKKDAGQPRNACSANRLDRVGAQDRSRQAASHGVSHEASRTGAPILALNIAQQLAKKYNVITVVLGGGELRAEFLATSIGMCELDRSKMNDARIAAIIQEICRRHEIAYALVNSVESRSVLPGLKAAGVPVSLCSTNSLPIPGR